MHTPSTKRFAHPAWIEIDLDQFVKNIQALKKFAPGKKICLTVKANAYGHGIIPISKAAEEHGVDYLAVAHSQEGAMLREAGITIPILVLGAIHEEQLPDLLKYDLEFTIASAYKAELVAKICKQLNKTAKVHVEVETGMQRTGMRPETALKLIENLANYQGLDLAGVYSHLAISEIADHATSHQQIAAFKDLTAKIKKNHPQVILHMANSGAVLNYPESHLDMLRVGILLFGYGVPATHHLSSNIRPFFSVKGKISFFKTVAANQGVSYGHTYQTAEQTHIVTIPIGYGDGLRRALSNKGSVLIHNQRYPIVGAVCMDQFMVDIGMNEAHVGDEVVIIGEQGNQYLALEEMATSIHTIPNEILCGFNDRLPRLYKYNNIMPAKD